MSFENNEGIESGTITIINRNSPSYELPETGGIGTWPFILAGLCLTAALVSLYWHKKYSDS